jgi:hypothetical protein
MYEPPVTRRSMGRPIRKKESFCLDISWRPAMEARFKSFPVKKAKGHMWQILAIARSCSRRYSNKEEFCAFSVVT